MKFLVNVAWYGLAQLFAGALMFFYIVAAARLLGTIENYALFQAFMGIYGVVFVIGFPLNVLTIQQVGSRQDDLDPLTTCLRMGQIVGTVSCASVLLCIPILQVVLRCPDPLPIIAIAVLLAVAFQLTVFYGWLQGHNRYGTFACAKVLEAFLSCFAGCLLMYLGCGVLGAILGYVIGMSSVLIYYFLTVGLPRPVSIDWLKQVRRIGYPVLVSAVLMISVAGPMVISRWRMDELNAGLFAALFTFRNIVQPFALAVSLPLFSWTLKKKQDGGSLTKALQIVFAIGISFVAISVVAPELVVQILLGDSYLAASEFLAAYAVSLLLYMICMVLMFYMAATNRLNSIALLMPLVSVVGLCLHSNPDVSVAIAFQIIGWTLFLTSSLIGAIRAPEKSTTGSTP